MFDESDIKSSAIRVHEILLRILLDKCKEEHSFSKEFEEKISHMLNPAADDT